MKIYDANLTLDNCGFYYTGSNLSGHINFNVYLEYAVINNVVIKLVGTYEISSRIKNKEDDGYAATIYSKEFFEKDYKILKESVIMNVGEQLISFSLPIPKTGLASTLSEKNGSVYYNLSVFIGDVNIINQPINIIASLFKMSRWNDMLKQDSVTLKAGCRTCSLGPVTLLVDISKSDFEIGQTAPVYFALYNKTHRSFSISFSIKRSIKFYVKEESTDKYVESIYTLLKEVVCDIKSHTRQEGKFYVNIPNQCLPTLPNVIDDIVSSDILKVKAKPKMSLTSALFVVLPIIIT